MRSAKYASYQHRVREFEQAIQASQQPKANEDHARFRLQYPARTAWGAAFAVLAVASGVLGWSVVAGEQGALVFYVLFLLFGAMALVALLSVIVRSPTA